MRLADEDNPSAPRTSASTLGWGSSLFVHGLVLTVLAGVAPHLSSPAPTTIARLDIRLTPAPGADTAPPLQATPTQTASAPSSPARAAMAAPRDVPRPPAVQTAPRVHAVESATTSMEVQQRPAAQARRDAPSPATILTAVRTDVAQERTPASVVTTSVHTGETAQSVVAESPTPRTHSDTATESLPTQTRSPQVEARPTIHQRPAPLSASPQADPSTPPEVSDLTSSVSEPDRQPATETAAADAQGEPHEDTAATGQGAGMDPTDSPSNDTADSPASAHSANTQGSAEAHPSQPASALADDSRSQQASSAPAAPDSGSMLLASPTPSTASTNSPALVRQADYGWLMDSLRRRVDSLKAYPRLARMQGWEGRVVVRATISHDGHLVEAVVTSSSGYAALDDDALRLMRRSCPLHLPQGLDRAQVDVFIPVHYRLQ